NFTLYYHPFNPVEKNPINYVFYFSHCGDSERVCFDRRKQGFTVYVRICLYPFKWQEMELNLVPPGEPIRVKYPHEDGYRYADFTFAHEYSPNIPSYHLEAMTAWQ